MKKFLSRPKIKNEKYGKNEKFLNSKESAQLHVMHHVVFKNCLESMLELIESVYIRKNAKRGSGDF